ncbi:DoxX family protein [Planctomycetota bacterium]|nr:DoxX family protein [Planctomycetota bacterium]
MCCHVRGLVSLLGRVFLVLIFLMSAVGNKIPNFEGTAAYMASEGMPMPKVMLAGGIVFLIVGGLSVLLGLGARVGAVMLGVFLFLATYYFHDFWNFEPEQQEMQMIAFMKNLALFGAMMFIFANGAGAWSVDGLLKKVLGGKGSCKKDKEESKAAIDL